MADPVAAPPSSDPLAPGETTSEGFMAKLGHYVGIALVVVGGLQSVLQGLISALPQVTWLGPVLAALGVIVSVAHSLGYTASRTAIKVAALSTPDAVATLAAK